MAVDLSPYLTNPTEDVFCLQNLPEEVVSVLLAFYSRSPESLKGSLAKMIEDGLVPPAPPTLDYSGAEEKARKFHDQWTVGFGHGSVAEHSVIHVGVENCSILAAKAIEDCRLASYTEKSTRYIPWKREWVYQPVDGTGYADGFGVAYRCSVENDLFDTYERLLPLVQEKVAEEADRSEYKTERGWTNACLAQACDLLRGLLPAGSLTSLGITMNARTAAHMVRKLRAHPLPEVRTLGERILTEGRKLLPTLLKYGDPEPDRLETPAAIRGVWEELVDTQAVDWLGGLARADLRRYPGNERSGSAGASQPGPAVPVPANLVRLACEGEPLDVILELVATALYEQANVPYYLVFNLAARMTEAERLCILEEYTFRRRREYERGGEIRVRWDQPGRALENHRFKLEFTVDYGTWRDLQRHRMGTQLVQDLGVDLGYEVPEALVRYGLDGEFREALDTAAVTFQDLKGWPERVYLVPLAYRIRALCLWDFRELIHVIELRSGREGHPSYRKLAQSLWTQLDAWCPELASLVHPDMSEYHLARKER